MHKIGYITILISYFIPSKLLWTSLCVRNLSIFKGYEKPTVLFK